MSEQNNNNDVPVPPNFESFVFSRHHDANDSDGVPAAARLAISQSERHLAQCDGIPERLRAVLLAAESNCRVNGGVVPPCVQIDQASDCIPIPPTVPIIDFVLQCLSLYATDRADAIITVNDELRVLHLSTSDSYECSCSIERDDTAVTLGTWTIRPVQQATAVGKNQPCPCGSGRKYKRCCMRHTPSERPLTKDEFAQQLKDSIAEAGEAESIEYSSEEFSLSTSTGRKMSLANIYAEFGQAMPHERGELMTRYRRLWFQNGQAIPDEFDDARPDLLPVVRNRIQMELDNESASLHLIGEHLAIDLVFDMPDCISSIDKRMLDSWQTDYETAYEVALNNLNEISQPPRFVRSVRGVWTSYFEGPFLDYVHAQILLTDLVAALEVDGDLIAMIPNRQTILITGSEQLDGLDSMAEIALSATEKPRFISGIPIALQDGTWRDFELPCDHQAGPKFKELRDITRYHVYASQKSKLDKTNLQAGLDIFVANAFRLGGKDDEPSQTACVLTESIDSLLPKTDMVFVVRFDISDALIPPDSAVTSAFVPWDKAYEILQGVMIRTDDWPARYRVGGSFTDEQWEALLAASLPAPRP